MVKKERSAFTIAWVCALSHELTASEAMFDEEYERFEGQDGNDNNIYITGSVHKHDVVMVCLPRAGKSAASSAVTNLVRTFPSVRFALMVGIGGAVPDDVDIRLGDIVISEPDGRHNGVIQYDLGKSTTQGFEERGQLSKPPQLLLSAIRTIRARHDRKDPALWANVERALQDNPRMRQKYIYPGFYKDRLYETTCIHGSEKGCNECDGQEEITRSPRRDWSEKDDFHPRIFHGLIASGDTVIASAEDRKRLHRHNKMLCFEMEAAGLIDTFPCLVIRGMSDYADANKRDDWQCYAALTAAACARELLEFVPLSMVQQVERAVKTTTLGPPIYSNLPPMNYSLGSEQQQVVDKLVAMLLKGSQEKRESLVIALKAGHGRYKTRIVRRACQQLKGSFKGLFWVDARSESSAESGFKSLARILFTDISRLLEADTVRLVVQTLEAWSERWLLVLDHYNDLERFQNLEKFMPQNKNGAILITSRHDGVSRLGKVLNLD